MGWGRGVGLMAEGRRAWRLEMFFDGDSGLEARGTLRGLWGLALSLEVVVASWDRRGGLWERDWDVGGDLLACNPAYSRLFFHPDTGALQCLSTVASGTVR